MIKQILLNIDLYETYTLVDNEISVCMEFPRAKNASPNTYIIGNSGRQYNSPIKTKFNDECNFYKYIIKKLIQ